ncbi:MAG: DUF2258 domain-containing protein [Pyrodictiaceae archaeon]
MAQLSTGLVIAGAYADKIRRVLFAQLRDDIKSGKISSQQVAFRAGELNRLLYEILVNRLKMDKGDVVRIRVEYELVDSDIKWNLESLQLEAFRRLPAEEVEKAVKEVIEKAGEILKAPPTEAEREWTGEAVQAVKISIASAVELGETPSGEKIFLLKDEKGENLGIAIASGSEGRRSVQAIVVKDHEAYHAEIPIEELMAEELAKRLSEASFQKMDKSEAEKIIKEKMLEIV